LGPNATIIVALLLLAYQKETGESEINPALGFQGGGSALASISEAELRSNVETLVSFGTRNLYSEQNSNSHGIGAAQRWIESKFRSFAEGKGDRFRVFKDCFTYAGRTICNVGAILTGDQKPRDYFVISGHYDSMPDSATDGVSEAPGADDDASGTAVVIEAARVLSQNGSGVSVIFLAAVGEEQGLVGSRHFAKYLKGRGARVVGMITNDIVGSSDGVEGGAYRKDPNRLRVYSDWGGSYGTGSKALAQKAKSAVEGQMAENLNLDLKTTVDRSGRSGDHVAFLEQGYPAIRFIEPYEDLRHQHRNIRQSGGVQYGDLTRYLEFDFMAKVVAANILTILAH